MSEPGPSSSPNSNWESLHHTERWCNSHVHVFKCSYTWTIHNFAVRTEGKRECFESPTFSADDSKTIEWCVKVYPKGDEANEGHLSVYLQRATCKNTVTLARFTFSILNAEGEKKLVKETKVQTYDNVNNVWGHGKFISHDFLLNEANGLLCNDKLTLHCELEVFDEPIHVLCKWDSSSVRVPKCDLAEDMETLFTNKTFSDVVLSVEGHELAAHKNILCARSPVFAAMFDHEMKETIQSRVEIADLDYEVLKIMLVFMYTGKAPGLKTRAEAVLAAANKYSLDRLKAMCEEALSPTLTIHNAADLLVLADLYCAYQLKAHALDFVVLHALHVMHTRGWELLSKHHPDLVAEVCKALAFQKSSCKRLKLQCESQNT